MAGNAMRNRAWNQQIKTVLLNYHEVILRLIEPLSSHSDGCQLATILKTDCLDIDPPQFYDHLFAGEDLSAKSPEFLEQRATLLLGVLRLSFTKYGIVAAINIQHFSDLYLCMVSLIEKLKILKQTFYDIISDFAGFIGEKILPAVGILAAPFAATFVDCSLRLLNISFARSYALRQGVFFLFAELARYLGPSSLPTFQRMVSKGLPFTERILQGDWATCEKSRTEDIPPPAEPKKQSTRKRKAILMEEMAQERRARIRKEMMTSDRLVVSACLRMWEAILRSAGSFIRPTDFRQLQQSVCQLLMRMNNKTWLATSAQCRREAYGLLNALVACPHPFRPSVLQCAIRIFETGLTRDEDPHVVEACRSGLSTCALVAKPLAPYLESVMATELEDAQPEGSADSTIGYAKPAAVASLTQSSGAPDTSATSDTMEAAVPNLETKEAPMIPNLVRRDEPLAQPAEPSSAAIEAVTQPEASAIEENGNAESCAATSGIEAVMVTIEDDESDSDVVACSDGSLESSKGVHSQGNGKNHEEHQADVTTLLAGFVDAPAEETDIYID